MTPLLHRRLPGPRTWILLLTLLAGPAAPAQFQPVALTPESYNADVIVEKEAPPPVVPVTTASMETGSANTSWSWFERGYNVAQPEAGLPHPGLVFGVEQWDHDYLMASYTAPNALMLDPQTTSGTLTVTTARRCGVLSFLACSAGAAVSLAYTVQHQDGSTEAGTLAPPNWVSGVPPAYYATGRIDVQAFTFQGVGTQTGRLFSLDVTVTNTASPVTHIALQHAGGTGRAVIFAVSSLAPEAASDERFLPLPVQGYNQDLVVEAGAPRTGWLGCASATLETGFENRRYTLFEQGYLASAPQTGVPHPGGLVVPAGAPGSSFALATNYLENNAVVLDTTCRSATLTPQTPAPYAALVFLAASSHGPVTNSCVVLHADGSRETNAWVAPDYITGNGPAWTANGRVDLSTRLLDCLGPGQVRLFAASCPLANTGSPVVEVTLAFSGASGAVCTVLAVSAVAPGPTRPLLALQTQSDGAFSLSTTMPGILESADRPDAPPGEWREEGPVAGTVRVAPRVEEEARFYRVRVN